MNNNNNSITEINGLEILQNLKEISVKNCKIERIKGFEQFPNLTKLYLQNNQIRKLKGLKNLKKLKTINLSKNKIVEIDCRQLPLAENIDLTDNLIMKIKNPSYSSRFVISCKINNKFEVKMEGNGVRIFGNNNASILLKDHSIFIEKNGLLHQHTVLDKKYSGFTEFTAIIKKTRLRKKTKIQISKVYPLRIDKINHDLEAQFREICSNLLIWVENDYDLRLLRKDLIIPLMEQLGEKKDAVAEKAFKEFKNYNKPQEEAEQISKNSVKGSLKGTTLKRKLFNPDTNDLLSVLYFNDFHDIEIKLLTPEAKPIKEVSERCIRIFIKGALMKIKEENPLLSLKYSFFKNSDIIEHIKISNLHSIHDYDLITEKMQELLSTV